MDSSEELPRGEIIIEEESGKKSFMFDCPACGISHSLRLTDGSANDNGGWWWCGSMSSPTFNPSLLVRWGKGPNEKCGDRVCHSFIRDGYIEYLTDCTHELAGKTIRLPPYED
jgi:hypothetical protein